MKRPAFQASSASAEGIELHCKARGTGLPLLFIAPAGGNGDVYLQAADILSKTYRVLTYDRRVVAGKTDARTFDILQQSRDACAVLSHFGVETAYVAGSGIGAIIALAVAAEFPAYVRAVVAHEPTLASLDSNGAELFKQCAELAKFEGAKKALEALLKGSEIPAFKLSLAERQASFYARAERRQKSKDNPEDKLQELLEASTSVLNLKAVMSLAYVACGQYALGRKTWVAGVASAISGTLSCELATFPGHHGSYMDRPDEWAAALRKALQKSRIKPGRLGAGV
ncbi:MAG: alpha/beta fold hydrolase [Clostridiales bacterium]|nr:alpha/beta fold hydrolase [Clostridiales bacterium]